MPNLNEKSSFGPNVTLMDKIELILSDDPKDIERKLNMGKKFDDDCKKL